MPMWAAAWKTQATTSNFGTTADALRRAGNSWGLVNAPLIRDGCIAPPDGPGWGAEWDEERFRKLTVARH